MLVCCNSDQLVDWLTKNLAPDKFTLSGVTVQALADRYAKRVVEGEKADDGGLFPDLFIVDLSVDKDYGLAICQLLTDKTLTQAAPVIALAAENDFETAEQAILAGARDFAMLPLDGRSLSQKLEFMARLHNRIKAGGVGHLPEASGMRIFGWPEESLDVGHDPVTGLPEMDLFRKLASRKLRRLPGGQKQGAALFLINLDHFKRVRSILGRDASNALLKRVTRRMEAAAFLFLHRLPGRKRHEEGVIVGRIGLDEFVMLAPEISEAEQIESLARLILESISRYDENINQKVYLTARIGISLAPQDGWDIDRMLKNAESAMHFEGKQGRDSFRLYKSGMTASATRRFELEAELSQALVQGALQVHYQPQIDLVADRISGAEALVRWKHPQLGLMPPEIFIAVAEDVGLIAEIGDWVLKEACTQCRKWHDMGFRSLQISINISPYQFSRVNMSELVRRALQDARLEPESLTLEVTESLVISNVENTLNTMLELKRMGVKLALDDFGTGYSSLSYLHSLSVDYLKIDRAFVKELPYHAGGLAVTEAIIRMAKALGLGITAEGVESEEQLKRLRVLGCDYYQGYLFSEPLPTEAFTKLLVREDSHLTAISK